MENNETVTTTVEPVVEETKVEVGKEPEVKLTKEEDNKVNYVKQRVERAKEQTTQGILKELGVENIEDAKKLMKDGSQALQEITELKEKLQEQEHARELYYKKEKLTSILDKEYVFDADALINYLDLDKVNLDENGDIVDADGIITSLKKAKPNFFGTVKGTSDTYIKGSVSTPTTALDKQNNGNTIGAINDYLKTILK